MKFKIFITPDKLYITSSEFTERVKKAAAKGLLEGADDIRDHLKHNIMSGQILKIRSGQLKNSLYVNRQTPLQLAIMFRGTHRRDEYSGENAELASLLEKGRTEPWWQPKRNKWHPGIRAKNFVQKGLNEKRANVRNLVEARVREALRRR